jgi:hypothetical protein
MIFSFVRDKIRIQRGGQHFVFPTDDGVFSAHVYTALNCTAQNTGYEGRSCWIKYNKITGTNPAEGISFSIRCDGCAHEIDALFPEKQTFLQRRLLINSLNVGASYDCVLHSRAKGANADIERPGYCGVCARQHSEETYQLITRALFVEQLGLVADVERAIIWLLICVA